MRKKIFFGLLLVGISSYLMAEPPLTPLDPNEISEMKQKLVDHTTGYGEPISNREVWDKLAADSTAQEVIAIAEKMIQEPFPVWDESLIIQYPITGIRKEADIMYKARTKHISALVVAECLENKGRFMRAIERTLNEMCTQPSWVMVAHDPDLDNFWGRAFHVDLGAASLADRLGQAIYMLGDKISEPTLTRLKATLQERIYDPVLNAYRTLETNGSRMSWITRHNNWNLVCIAGVTSSVLATCDDKDVRAEFATAAEKYIQYGINGFLEDGYCPEGIGYYNYGFSYLIRLRECLYRATEGEVDLFKHPRMQKIATFGQRSEIINGVFPAITDCRPNTIPSDWVMWYCNTAFGWEVKNPVPANFLGSGLVDNLIRVFSNSPCKVDASADDLSIGLRSYFDKADVLTCRPAAQNWDNSLAITIKGGTNNESHNHNDVGSYTIVAGSDMMMGDMGGPVNYTSKTFSAERYTLYRMFASYGHPVPQFGDVEQYESAKAVGKAIKRKFTTNKDDITYDLITTYPLPELKSLTRRFQYNRANKGQVAVTDRFKASKALPFETSITTRQQVALRDGKIYLESENHTVEVTIKSSAPYTITQNTVEAYAFEPFTRVGIVLKENVSNAEVTLTYNIVK